MTPARLRRVIAIVLAAGAAASSAALAQIATPIGDFGGGAMAVPVRETSVARDMLLAIRAPGNARIGVDGHLFARCGLGTITGDAQLAGDGSFTLRGRSTRRPLVGVRHTTTFLVRGRLTPDGGRGTARMRLRVGMQGRRARTCRSRSVRWTVRRLAGGLGAAPAPGEATLYGLTEQDATRSRRAIVLRTSAGGRSIERLAFGFRLACERRRVVVSDDVNTTGEFDVSANGSFREVERFRRTFRDVIVNTTIVVRGQFDQTGAAAGRLSVVERHRNRRNGERVDVCRSGTQTWSARQ